MIGRVLVWCGVCPCNFICPSRQQIVIEVEVYGLIITDAESCIGL